MTPSLEDYLEAILVLSCEDGAHVSAIAARLNVTKPSVNKAISELKKMEYVKQEPYGVVELTEMGLCHAREILRRHRLLKEFLMLLSVSEETAEQDACKMEHLLSRESLDRIAEHCVKIRKMNPDA